MIKENLNTLISKLPSGVRLVAVSKYHNAGEILEAYEAGQRVFAESRPQELVEKLKLCPDDIEWHFIGHLQTNKLKMVLPYVSLVQSVDSVHLLSEIDRWGKANGRTVPVLLEMHIAAEQTKQGFVEEEILELLLSVAGDGRFPNVRFCGLMGMATNTDDDAAVDADFARIEDFFLYLRDLLPELTSFSELSIGMSGDWPAAIRHGATMVRLGTCLFGEKNRPD